MAQNYNYNQSYTTRPQFKYENGKTFKWDPSLHSYLPYPPNQNTGGYGSTNASGLMPPNQSIKANAGNVLPDWAKKMLDEMNGYQSKYEPMLEQQLNRQSPNQANPYTNRIASIADQIANFKPTGILPPEIAARLATMKSSALAGVDKQANKASDQLAGMLWSNTGGGEGSAALSARASLADSIGGLRQGVESDFAGRELQALNEYNSQQLAALQAGMSGYGAAGGFAGQDIDRLLNNFQADRGANIGILDRLLSSERDRNAQRRNLIMEIMGRYGG